MFGADMCMFHIYTKFHMFSCNNLLFQTVPVAEQSKAYALDALLLGVCVTTSLDAWMTVLVFLCCVILCR
jgi:Na+-translocating ferredoxin:NAD+ oxidoreductase RnfD subunit